MDRPEVLFKMSVKITILMGISGSGKSTFVKDTVQNICSTDKFVEEIGNERGLNYSESFEFIQAQNKFGEITKRFYNEIEDNIKNGNDFVIDRTNLTKESRASLMRELRLMGDLYKQEVFIEGIAFNPDLVTIMYRLEKRVNEEHKEIPEDVIARQVEAFEIPTDDEGFDVLVIIK